MATKGKRVPVIPESQQNILAQFYVAFGQGAGTMRVHRGTVAALRERYRRNLADWEKRWDDIGAQMLERVRAIGRLAAHRATSGAHTAIRPEHFDSSANEVERTSASTECPPPPPMAPTVRKGKVKTK